VLVVVDVDVDVDVNVNEYDGYNKWLDGWRDERMN
jgi:hypothetical protein